METKRNTGEPPPQKWFSFFPVNILLWVKHGASSQSLLSPPATAAGLTMAHAEKPAIRQWAQGRGHHCFGWLSPCSAQLWQHMLSVQSQRRTGCCPGTLWAASSLLGSKEMVKWNVPGREGERSWAVMGTAVIRGTEERQKGMKGCVKCQKDREGRGQNAEERPVAGPRAISYLK